MITTDERTEVRAAPLAAYLDRLITKRELEVNPNRYALPQSEAAEAKRLICEWAGITKEALRRWHDPTMEIEFGQADSVLTRLGICWWDAYDPDATPALYDETEWLDVIDEAGIAFEGDEWIGELDAANEYRQRHPVSRRASGICMPVGEVQSAPARISRPEVEVPRAWQGRTTDQQTLLRQANPGRPLIVGEAPGRGDGDPLMGACGRRLGEWSGLGGARELDVAFELTNLLAAWPGALGKGAAWPADEAFDEARRRPLRGVCVLLGQRVALAYGLDDLGFGVWLRTRRAIACAIPHPSGVNRLYNEATWRDLAGVVLREALMWTVSELYDARERERMVA